MCYCQRGRGRMQPSLSQEARGTFLAEWRGRGQKNKRTEANDHPAGESERMKLTPYHTAGTQAVGVFESSGIIIVTVIIMNVQIYTCGCDLTMIWIPLTPCINFLSVICFIWV